VRIYTDDTNFISDVLIKDGKEYFTKETNLTIGTFNHKALIRDETGDFYLSIYSPDLKKITIITNDFAKKGHDYLIPEITNVAKNKIEGIQEEVFLKRFLDKHAREIFFFLSIFFLFLVVTNLKSTIEKLGNYLSASSQAMTHLADVINATKIAPIN